MRRKAFILLLGVLCGPVHAAPTVPAPDTLEARAQGCSTCHGAHGEGVRNLEFPRIAGKPAGYLLHQLQNFRGGQRSYPPMNYLLANLQDDYLAELANYFAVQKVEAPPLAPRATATAGGERLVRQGDAARGVPACVLCHGKLLTGMEPGHSGAVRIEWPLHRRTARLVARRHAACE